MSPHGAGSQIDGRTPARGRQLRVFISSTFRDMHAEREELVKQVFPQLRKLCEQRGVVWSDVDLRWGVTDEQKAEGHALPICLAEIERCRPYFIGLLGERYGPPVDTIHPDVLAREPWLKDHLDRSLTEMEILHGALRNPTMAEHAFFYFRDPAYLDRLPEGANLADFRSENADQAERLQQLKARIRATGFRVQENYADPKALGQLVLADFTALIDQLYPKDSEPSQLDRETMDQDLYAASRERAYIRRPADFHALDGHAAGQGEPLVVLGESGVGKSALLANWALDWRQRNPGVLLLLHFVGSTPGSADWVGIVRRILGELQRHLGLALEIPDKPDALRAVFANALHMAAVQGRVVLVIDALNQLEDRDGAPDLVWLPPVIPANVRLILSTLPGRPLNDLRKRGWPVLAVEPLHVEERRQLITDYLAFYSRTLSPSSVQRIATAEQSANPLYLRALLEELQVFGSHERLGQRIEHYLEARDVPGLFGRILARWEEDYERDRPGLVGGALSLIWAARRGLSESELLDLLGGGEPMPMASWSPLNLAAGVSLTNRSGLIGFAHDFVRAAVEKRFVPEPRDVHMRLADYFGLRAMDRRTVDELPWQLQQGSAWLRLGSLLSGEEFFAAAWAIGDGDVRAYWIQIEAHSPLRIVESFRPTIENPSANPDHAARLNVFLADAGHPEEALRVSTALAEHYRQQADTARLAACLGGQAFNLHALGNLDGAMALYKQGERIYRELGNQRGLANSLLNQALILKAHGDLDGAMALHKEGERVFRGLGDKEGLARSFANQAPILIARGDLDGAMALLKQAERICWEIGDKTGLSNSLGNQALILQARGDLDGAMALLKEKERVCWETGNKAGLSNSLGSQAVILQARGDLDGAMALLKESERVFRGLGDKEGLARSLGNQAVILMVRGNLGGAMALLKEAERLCRELGNIEELAILLANRASILQGLPNGLMEARQLADEAFQLASTHGYIAVSRQILAIRSSIRGDTLQTKPENSLPKSWID